MNIYIYVYAPVCASHSLCCSECASVARVRPTVEVETAEKEKKKGSTRVMT